MRLRMCACARASVPNDRVVGTQMRSSQGCGDTFVLWGLSPQHKVKSSLHSIMGTNLGCGGGPRNVFLVKKNSDMHNP